jgi:energy-coupling factor transport system substrate-specific component
MAALRTRFPRYSTLEIVIMIVTGAAFGVIGLGLNVLALFLIGTLGLWVAYLLAGPFASCGLVAARIIRKPGVAFVTHMLFGVASVLLGDPFGLWNLVYSFTQGVAFEVGLAAFRYQRWDWIPIMLGAALTVPFEFVPVYFSFGWSQQPLWSWLGPELLKPIYIQPWVLLLAVAVPDLLERRGVIKQGAIG